jgi:methylglutamate dehydrogenase subunit B
MRRGRAPNPTYIERLAIVRIPCPFCGERDSTEFAYHGDAKYRRPVPGGPEAANEFYQAVYLRDNPAGPHTELWYHANGCRSWLKVTRNTRTHEILAAELARQA